MLPVGAVYARTDFLIVTQTAPAPAGVQFVSSSPRDNEAFDTLPQTITVTFSQGIAPDGNTITLYDPYNNALNDGKATTNVNAMVIRMPSLKQGSAGIYRAEWKTKCLCGEDKDLSGTIHFVIH